MLIYQNVEFSIIKKTGKINIKCNEDFNFEVEAYGRVPRQKDLIKAINKMYEQIEAHEDGYNKLKTHKISVKSNAMMGRGKTRKSKNRKTVWGDNPNQMKEEFFKSILSNKV